MKGLFKVKGVGAAKKGHVFAIGKVPHYAKEMEEKIKRIGRVSIPRGKQKLFKIPVRIPRGIKI